MEEYATIDRQYKPCKFVEYRSWQYCWSTTRAKDPPDPDKPWKAWTQKPSDYLDNEPIKVSWFAKRASAKRSAIRRKQAHIDRNARQRIRSLCSKCEARVKMKDDYLCRKCRYG